MGLTPKRSSALPTRGPTNAPAVPATRVDWGKTAAPQPISLEMGGRKTGKVPMSTGARPSAMHTAHANAALTALDIRRPVNCGKAATVKDQCVTFLLTQPQYPTNDDRVIAGFVTSVGLAFESRVILRQKR